MTVDTRAKQFEKNFSKEVSKRPDFGHEMMNHVLKKFPGGGVNLPNFSHVGVRGVWLNVQREFRPGKKICSGVSKIADFRHL